VHIPVRQLDGRAFSHHRVSSLEGFLVIGQLIKNNLVNVKPFL
jgi:hypothetical protein